MTFVPKYELLLATSGYPHIHVYDIGTTEKPRAVVTHHIDTAMDVAHLEDDIVASFGDDYMLCTWRATTEQLVDKWKHYRPLRRVAMVEKNRLVVVNNSGTMIVLEHESGSNFRKVLRVDTPHLDGVAHIFVSRDCFVLSLAPHDDNPVRLWNPTSFAPLATLRPDEPLNSAAVSDRHILLACLSGNIYVHHNSEHYRLEFAIHLGEEDLFAIVLVSEDVVAVSGTSGILYFISLSAKLILSKIELESAANSIVVLSGGRLAVSCVSGYSAFIELPESVYQIVKNSAAALYAGRFFEAIHGICRSRIAEIPRIQKSRTGLLTKS